MVGDAFSLFWSSSQPFASLKQQALNGIGAVTLQYICNCPQHLVEIDLSIYARRHFIVAHS
jgi:hypothetical protein